MSDDIFNKYGVPKEVDRAPSDAPDLFAKYGVPPADADLKSPVSSGADAVLDTAKNIGGKALDYGLRGLGYAGGLTQDAFLEALKRYQSGGSKGVGAEEWGKALRGQATPISKRLETEAGMDSLTAAAIGIPAEIALDPLTYLSGGLSSVNKLAKLKKAANGVGAWSKLNEAKDAIQGSKILNPIGTSLQKMGKSAFSAPFKKADAAVAKYTDSAKRGAHEFSDYLFNNGDPLVGGLGKGSKDIADEITALRKGKGAQIGDAIKAAGGVGEVHPAPTLSSTLEEAFANDAAKIGLDPKAIQGADHYAWIKQKLAGDKVARAEAIETLKKGAPEFSEIFDRYGSRLANQNDRAEALDTFHTLLGDLQEGPRSLEGLQDLKGSYQRAAARNQAMGGDMYTKNRLPNQGKMAAKDIAGELGDKIENLITSSVDKAGDFGQLKKDYSILRRGELPAIKTAEQAMARPYLSKLDMLSGGLGMAAGAHDAEMALKAALIAAPVKVGHEMTRNPALGTLIGRGMNATGKKNIWDRMAQKAMVDLNNGGDQ